LKSKGRERSGSGEGINPRVSDRIGHLMALSPEMEDTLLDRILYLEQRGLRLTPIQLSWVDFNLEEVSEFNHTWNRVNKVEGTDWFGTFLRRQLKRSL
jgi:hypothetical protein